MQFTPFTWTHLNASIYAVRKHACVLEDFTDLEGAELNNQ